MKADSVKQAVHGGVTGVVVDRKMSSIVEGIALLLVDAGVAARMGAAGYERALREFSWDKMAEQTRLLEKIN